MGAPKKPQPGPLLQILMPLCMLASIGLVMILVIQPDEGPSPLIIGGILALLFGWIGISVLWPARADRRCQQCKTEYLQRMDPASALGLVCAQCGWSDATASGWYFAEEELDALEPLAMERRQARAGVSQANVDTGSSPD